MEKKLYVTFSDGLGMVRVEIDKDGIISDGYRMIFSDANGKEYCVPSSDVYNIVME